MRKFPIFILLAVFVVSLFSCTGDESSWDKYEDWRIKNNAWLLEQMEKKNDDGTPYYTKLVPRWDKQAFILIKYLNDTTLTQKNLKPLYTSTVKVKYIGRLYDDTAFDSSYLKTDSLYQTSLQSVIGGWVIGLTNMHIGDSCELVIPYQSGYGSSGTTGINPYSNLKFHVKLVEIPGLVVPVK